MPRLRILKLVSSEHALFGEHMSTEKMPGWAIQQSRECTAHLNFDSTAGRYECEHRIAHTLVKTRNKALEEAAKECESWCDDWNEHQSTLAKKARAIRSLKGTP